MKATSSDGNRDPDSFDLRGSGLAIIGAVRRYRGVALATLLLTLGLVLLYYVVWPPIYTASAVLMAESEVDYARDSFYVGWNTFRKDDSRTEMVMMTSAPVLENVIRRQKLTYDDVHHPIPAQLAYFWERSPVGRAYRYVKRRIFPEDADMPSPEQRDFARTLLDLRASISVDPLGESNSARLTVRAPSRRVASIANAVVDAYMADHRKRHVSEAEASLEALSGEVGRALAEVDALEAKRLTFSEDNGLTFEFQKHALEVAKLTDLEADINVYRAKVASLSASLREVEGQLALDPPTRSTSTEQEALRIKRLDVEGNLIQIRGRYRPDSPEVRELEETLARMDARIAEGALPRESTDSEGLNTVQQALLSRRNELSADIEGTRAALAVMEPTAAGLRAHLVGLPALQTEMRALDRELASAQEKYHVLVGKKAQAAASVITARAAAPSIRLVEPAAPPVRRSWPRPVILFPAGIVLGLILGTAAAVIRGYADGRVWREHVERGRGASPLYGTIGVTARSRPLEVVVRGGGSPPLRPPSHAAGDRR